MDFAEIHERILGHKQTICRIGMENMANLDFFEDIAGAVIYHPCNYRSEKLFVQIIGNGKAFGNRV
jgi:hypothetical protein